MEVMNMINTLSDVAKGFEFVAGILNDPHKIAIALIIAMIVAILVQVKTKRVTLSKLCGVASFFVVIFW